MQYSRHTKHDCHNPDLEWIAAVLQDVASLCESKALLGTAALVHRAIAMAEQELNLPEHNENRNSLNKDPIVGGKNARNRTNS